MGGPRCGWADCKGKITYAEGDEGEGYCSFDPTGEVLSHSRRLSNTTPAPPLICGHFKCEGYIHIICDCNRYCFKSTKP